MRTALFMSPCFYVLAQKQVAFRFFSLLISELCKDVPILFETLDVSVFFILIPYVFCLFDFALKIRILQVFLGA